MQACRAGGWFAYRPDETGRHIRADEQDWAKLHLQAAGRVSSQQLANRYNWLDSTGKPEMQCKDWQAVAAEGARGDEHNQQPEEGCLELDFEPCHLDRPEDYQEALAVLTHPSFRTDEDLMQQVKGLGLYQRAIARQQGAAGKQASRKTRKQRTRTLRPLTRALAQEFQAALAEAG